MRAYGNRILIDQTPIEEITAAGIIMPKEFLTVSAEKPSSGRVVSVGELVQGIKENDIIHFNKYTPVEVKEHDKTYLVIKDEDVYVIE